MSILAHWMYTAFGMLSGPGALYGLSWAITHFICVFNMAENGNFWVGYSSLELVHSSSSGSGKKVVTNALVFSSFDMASDADPSSHVPRFSMGTRALLPSVGAPDAFW